ncbi:MAG: Rid family detoxifying hydrolase [Actinobacteria bacterium]|nr:Rid family detoxifying hydrolase [Actinomycetota bacterium]
MKVRITTQNAPKPIGAYSQGVKAGNLVFASGQIPIDPSTGEMVVGGAREQTKRVIENLKMVLGAAGSSLDEVLKLTVFLADLDWFEEMNKVFSDYFSADPPAREVVEVARLPKGAGIEVSAIALSVGEK